jgi:exopolysaccharide biosynthesis polyprenyl glycosylphosphotransferase
MITEQEQLQGSGGPRHVRGVVGAAPDHDVRTDQATWHPSRRRQAAIVFAAAALAALVILVDEVTPLFVLCATVLSVGLVLPALIRPRAPVRVGVLGTTDCASALATELDLCGIRRYAVVGRISARFAECDRSDEWTIGSVADLSRLIDEHRIDLLLMGNGGARMEIFEAMTRSGMIPKAKLWELAAFYEDVFGHIPISEINNAWFQCILHPKYRPTPPLVKRALDVWSACVLGVATLPLMLALGWLVRRDGGPALFQQVRIGEGGKPFTMFKLRTMSIEAAGDVAWSSREDARVTKTGRWLRRTHLDELPQLLNVLRGEMSMVGPRPEQPLLVEQLEATIPFYSRRHQIRPGITGWAQVRCGYAGSAGGTTWKLCHDLYYLKHRSLALDLKILLRTVFAVAADQQWRDSRSTAFVQSPPAGEVEVTVATSAPAGALPIALETSASS